MIVFYDSSPQMLHGWEKSPSHIVLIPRAMFREEIGEVYSVFKRRG